MSKFTDNLQAFLGTLVFIVALPFILVFRLICMVLWVLIVLSPFILIGFIVWAVAQ